MKIQSKKTTQVNKPNQNTIKYAPQTPDTNRPNIGHPAPKITKSKKKKVQKNK